MKQGSVSCNNLGSFPSPGAPTYRENGVSVQKGWSSERIPHPAKLGGGRSRRHISFAASTPFYSGRTLPSKWEDAERWICSPVSGSGVGQNPSYHLQRRPKSKSGPINPPGIAFYSSSSPAMHVLEGGGSVRSPFATGVLMADGISLVYGGYGAAVAAAPQPCLGQNERDTERSGSVARRSDLGSDGSLPSSRDEKSVENRCRELSVPVEHLQRDAATQMSPEDSSCPSSPSPREAPSFCPSPLSIIPVAESDVIREVQVDKRTTTSNRFRRLGSGSKKKALQCIEDFYQTDTSAPGSVVIADKATEISKLDLNKDVIAKGGVSGLCAVDIYEKLSNRRFEREEAKINAWENLQRAKAEAAIRKLEMKLEKKRTASMDRIFNKLRMAQMKAQEMRSTISVKPERRISRVSHDNKIAFLFRKRYSLGYLSGCFTCYTR